MEFSREQFWADVADAQWRRLQDDILLRSLHYSPDKPMLDLLLISTSRPEELSMRMQQVDYNLEQRHKTGESGTLNSPFSLCFFCNLNAKE